MTQLIEQSLVPKATHLDFIAPKQFTRSTWFDLIFFFNFEQSVNPEKMEATLAWMKKIHAECSKVPNSKEQLECHSMKKKQWKNN